MVEQYFLKKLLEDGQAGFDPGMLKQRQKNYVFWAESEGLAALMIPHSTLFNCYLPVLQVPKEDVSEAFKTLKLSWLKISFHSCAACPSSSKFETRSAI